MTAIIKGQFVSNYNYRHIKIRYEPKDWKPTACAEWAVQAQAIFIIEIFYYGIKLLTLFRVLNDMFQYIHILVY